MKTCKRCNTAKPLSEFRPDERYADGCGSWCINCHREANKAWYESNKDKSKERSLAWAKSNPDAIKRSQRKYREANKDARAAKHLEWQKINKDKLRVISARRKAAKLRATPPYANTEAISAIYAEAMRQQEETGIRKHVDHIVPLQSKIVCGLHVHNNLQIIDGADNESKKNRWWPDMP